MSGYLRRLVERVHGRAEVLRPRVPSRFEPAPDASATPPSLLETHEGIVAAPVARSAADAIARAGPEPESAASHAAALDAPQPALRSIVQPAPEHGGTPPAVQVREAAPVHEPGESAALEERVRRAVARALASEERPEMAPAPLPAAPEPAPPERVVEREVRPAARRAAADATPGAPSPAPARTFLAAPPPLPQRREAATRQAAPAIADEPVPAIHVTIGRVEVRALPQPAPARGAARPANAGVSLDDYLRRRDRGAR